MRRGGVTGNKRYGTSGTQREATKHDWQQGGDDHKRDDHAFKFKHQF
jgi:hypothetical protein